MWKTQLPPTSLSTYLNTYLFIHPPIYSPSSQYTYLFFINLSMYLCIYSPTCLHTFQSTHLPLYVPTCLLTFLSTHLYIYTPTYLYTYLSTHLPIYTPTYLHTYPSTHLPIYIPTYLHTYLSYLQSSGTGS